MPKTVEERRTYQRAYYARNREHILAQRDAKREETLARLRDRYAKKDPEELRAKRRAYRAKNVDRIRAQNRASRLRNLDQVKAANARWRKENRVPSRDFSTTRSKVTTLYRFYNQAGALLYVGVTVDLSARLRHHRRNQPWFNDVDHARTTIARFPDRDEALDRERLAVIWEKPAHNIIYTSQVRP